MGDQFGSSIAIAGNNVLIGAPFDDTNGPEVGQAYLFNRSNPEPATLLLVAIGAAGLMRRRRAG
jgi:hypothetical protein